MNHKGVKDRQKPEYLAGVNEFLHFAFIRKSDGTMLKCPCLNCRLVLSQNRKNMQCHLLVYGIDPTYNPWVSHGESIQEIDNE
ncbi:E3 ubiquitin-protein ligase ubr3 [Bienertia sinuspersici]